MSDENKSEEIENTEATETATETPEATETEGTAKADPKPKAKKATAKKASDFKSRLVEESKDLTSKLKKLNKYLEATELADSDANILRSQRNAMASYLSIVNTRIKRLK